VPEHVDALVNLAKREYIWLEIISDSMEAILRRSVGGHARDAIPSEILEKRDKLTEDEWFIMRSHVYYTYQTLEPFEAFGIINSWGALHQERLNGTGYPFGYKEDDLPLGSRIIAVADVFTALTEHRPYRQGMEKKAALEKGRP